LSIRTIYKQHGITYLEAKNTEHNEKAERQQQLSGNIMKSYKKSYKSGAPPKLPVSRPTVVKLFSRIAGFILTGDALWFVFFGGILVAVLHVNHLPADTVLVLMIFAVLANAIFRGIQAWQDDFVEYRRNLAEYRMNMADIRYKQRVKKDIVWDRR
jgi:hypothetical protein